MGLVEVDEVAIAPGLEEVVAEFELRTPTPGTLTNGYALTFEGWFVPRREGVSQLRLESGPWGWSPVALNVASPDLASMHPELSWAAKSGFRTTLGAPALPRSFECRLVAELPERVLLAVVRGRRKSLPSPDDLRFQPIMLTTLARTGGTWLSHLLSEHPSILALRPFRYEARFATYWMDIFAALAEPESYLNCLSSQHAGAKNWWLKRSNQLPEPSTSEALFVEWLVREAIEDLLMMSHARVQRAYEELATIKERPDAAFFLERCPPDSICQRMLPELYPNGREIILVRDFRDMAASIIAYNRKRGTRLFGRAAASSDEEYISALGRQAAYLLNQHKARPEFSYLLRYEDLILSPRETLQALLTYIGANAETDVVDRMIRDADSSATDLQDAHRTSISAAASVGRWRRDLEPSLQVACEEAFGEVLSGLGYESS